MERVLGELVVRGAERFDLHVIARTVAPNLRSLVTWHRVRVPRRPFPLKFLAFAAVAGIRLWRVEPGLRHVTGALVPNRADVATVHFCHQGFRAATGRLVPPGPHGLRRLNTAASRLLAIAMERWCYRPERLRVAAAVSSMVARELAVLPHPVPTCVTPNGVDRSAFRPDTADRVRVRSELGVSTELVVLFVGGDWARKGLWPLLEAVARLVHDRLAVRLWVVGPGPVRRMRRRARVLGVAGNVEAMGVRRDVPSLMRGADVSAVPSTYETTPLVFLEAAASGLAQVVTDVGEMGDLVARYRCGCVVGGRGDDLIVALADALRRLATDADLRMAMAARGLAAVADRDWRDTSERTLDLYTRLLAGRAPSLGVPST
jgi:glycosyltransferase involved in cell wall biosynthesis